MEINMAKSEDPIEQYLIMLGKKQLDKMLTKRLMEEAVDNDDRDEEDTEESEDITLGDIRSEVYQMSQHIQMFTGIVTEGKAEIGDTRRRLEEMRLKLDLIQKNVLDITKELKEQFTGFDGLVFANEQLQGGIKEMKTRENEMISHLKQQAIQRSEHIATLQKQIKDAEQKVNEVSSNWRHYKSQNKQLRRANHELRTAMNKLEGKLEQLLPAPQESDITRQIKQVIDEVQDD